MVPGIKLPVLTADKGSDEKALKIIAKDNKHGNIFLIIIMILSVFSVTGLEPVTPTKQNFA